LLDNVQKGIIHKSYFTNKSSLVDLIDLFTCNPIVNYKNNVVTFCYKEGVVDVKSFTPIKSGPKTQENLIKKLKYSRFQNEKDACVLGVGVDVGVTNPFAINGFKMPVDESSEWVMLNEPLFTIETSQAFREEIMAYQQRTDEMNDQFNQQSIDLLPPEYKVEFDNLPEDINEVAKYNLLHTLNIPNNFLWDKMSNTTQFISDYLIQIGRGTETEKTITTKKGKEKILTIRDVNWFNTFKPKISEETGKARTEIKRDLQKNSDQFQKLAKSREQSCRTWVNNVTEEAKIKSGCPLIIFVIEALVKDNRVFSGKGHRAIGWHNFGKQKNERRWWVQAIHKAFQEQGVNHGYPVILCPPQYTSQTCPKCNHVDRDNRSGEKFKCLKYGWIGNADLDVGAYNIARVAITGKALSKPLEQKKIKKAKNKT